MKHKLRLLIVLAVAFFLGSAVMAQISEKGIPASFAFDQSDVLRSAKVPFVTPIQFDVAKLKLEDKVFEEEHLPLRVAMIIPVELNVRNSGEWTTLPNGQEIWRLTINAPGAIATMLYYDEFIIPKGGKLFIYNDEHSHLIGAYTENTNPKRDAFATEFVAGDVIILEYNAPMSVSAGENSFRLRPDIPGIKISGIGYGYNYLEIYRKPSDMSLRIGESASCQVNIACPEGDNWRDEQKGVARTVTPIGSTGSWLCSGTILNNTRQDMTPYYLAASHCFHANTGTTHLTTANWNQIMYYFHDDSPTCETAMPTNRLTLVGAQLLVENRLNGGSDLALLRLNSTIPLSHDIYFNGWDRRNTAATSGVGIHHPSGDVKKISTYTTAPTSSGANMGAEGNGAANAFWSLRFAETQSGWGQTEGGSSGSPLFNQNKLVVGTLTGGNSSCTNLTGTNVYGKLWYHWDAVNNAPTGVSDLTKRVRDYLDPDGTGAETLNGTYTVNNEAVADFSASATNIYVLESITYTDHSVGASNWEWTFEGGEPATYSGKTPPPVAYNAAGDFVTTLVANEGTGPQETKTMNINVTIKGTPDVPVADFGFPASGFTEGFDTQHTGAPYFPFSSSWILEKKPSHLSPNQWAYGNPSSANFSTIDASSLFSALVGWNAAHSDCWLKTSDSYQIESGASIEFYAGYGGSYLADATLNFLISTDDGATWTQLWTAGTANITRPFSWTRYTFDLTGYAGENVKFAWQYLGDDGDTMAIDGIKFSGGLASQITINVGDFLTPIDLSTGTPVLWNWTFDGANPSSADGQAPEVRYMTAGQYDVTLTVKNTEGEDTKTVTNAVTVVDRLPIINFVATSAGYTMQENYGPYIIPNKEVNFTDKTGNYPTSWNWAFTGGDPATSTDQSPQGVMYDVAGTFDVALTAENTAGPQTKTTTGFVKVGFDDPTRIWNLSYGESLASYAYSTGAVFGSNVYGGTGFSERFSAPIAGGKISKVDIKGYRSGATTGNMTVAVYNDNNGVPGAMITGASTTVAVTNFPQVASSSGAAYVTATFTTPVNVTGAFHIVITGLNSNGSGTTTRYVYISSAASRGALAKNTAYINYSGWRPASGVFTDMNTSLDVVPYFAYSADINADFKAEPAYTLKSNFNLYVPTYASLDFTDMSTGIPPNDWNWTFDGGNPATSTEQNPQVVFETDGNHNVSLSVANDFGGTGSRTKTGYVKSIYNEYNAITNLLQGEPGTSVYTWSTGNYLTGHNTFEITDFAERFEAPAAAGKVSKVEINFYRIAAAVSGTLTISVAKDEGGFPGTVLASKDLIANTTNFPANGARLITVEFDEPAFVDDAFFIVVSGYTGLSAGGVRNVAICTAADRYEGGKHTFYYNDQIEGGWLEVSEDIGLFTSLNIAPHLAYTTDIEAAFIAENGYTRQINYGRFIPTGESLNFFDNSLGVPTQWDWTFTGATPASSTDPNPQDIAYNADGEYAVKLSVKNLANVPDDSEVADYVKAGYDAPDKIWNMLPGDEGDTYFTSGAGFVTGSNGYDDKAFAERFDEPLAAGYISSVDINFIKVGTSGSLTVSIQKEKGGIPAGEILATKDLSLADITSEVYTTVTFDSPAYTDGAFYVVVSGFDQFAPFTVGILSSAFLSPTAKNTAYVLDEYDEWMPVMEPYFYMQPFPALSLNIVPTFTYIIPTFDVDGEFEVDRKNIDTTVETVSVTSSIPWRAETTASWVTIVDGSGDTDGEFTYTVSDNTSTRPRVAIITVAPIGLDLLQEVIIVRQSSTNPVNLTAEFDTNGDVEVNWDDITLTPGSAQQPAVAKTDKKDSPKNGKLSDEQLPFIKSFSSAGTLVRTMNVHTKSDRKFIPEDIDGTVVNENAVERNITPAPIAKSMLQSAVTETIVRWDDGSNSDAIGISNPSLKNYKIEVAALFTQTDLVSKNLPAGISKINKVEVYINDLPLDGITLKISQAKISYKQKVSNAQLTEGAFNTIVLDDPFILDKVSDTYIGYEFSIDGGMYVAGVDAGPAVVGKGDLISEQGSALFSLTEATGGYLDANWNIAAVVETGTFDNYILYRNGVAISQPTASTYLDTDALEVGDNCYQVSAVFDGLESTLSNDDCVYFIFPFTDLFEIPTGQTDFDAPGGSQDLTITVTDPNDYIGDLGLNFYVNAPAWISYTITGNVITFTATANTTGLLRTGTIQVWLGIAGSTFDPDNGYEIPVSQKSVLLASMLDFDLTAATYTGYPLPVSVTLNSAYSGLGDITVLYDGLTTAPTNAGTYAITINAGSGVNFEAATGLVIGNFVINKATLDIGMLNFDLSDVPYTGDPQPVSVTLDPPYSGLGAITILYDGSPTPPTEAGTYTITINVDAGDNFDAITGLVLGDFTIIKITFSIDMLDYIISNVTYSGYPQPVSVTYNYDYPGVGDITVLYNGSTTAPKNAGTYLVTIDVSAGTNFEALTDIYLGSFIISPAPLVVTPNNVSRLYGTPNPEFTVTVSGLVGEDNLKDAVFVILTTTAVESSLPGNYPIVVGLFSIPNYNPVFNEGVLTVSKLNQTIIAENIIMDINAEYSLGATVSSGLALTYSSSDPSIAQIDADGLITSFELGGTVVITITQAGNEIYAAQTVTIIVTVKDFTGIDTVSGQSIMVYPNPASKSTPVYVSADIDEAKLSGAIITVYNASGSFVKNAEVTGKLTKIDLPSSAGVYILSVKGKDGVVIKNMTVIVR